jgi:hypothetical protein
MLQSIPMRLSFAGFNFGATASNEIGDLEKAVTELNSGVRGNEKGVNAIP